MLVSDITTQRKNKQIYNIFVDGEFSFSLGDLELSASGLRIGIKLSAEQIKSFQYQSEFSKAYSRALNYLALRLHSEWELRQYLTKKEYQNSVIDEVVAKLLRLGYLNDQEFGRMWLQNRVLLKPKPRRVIEYELRQKHIDPEVIKQIILEFDDQAEQEALQSIIVKKQKIPRYQDERKLTELLMRQGFSFTQIKKALELSASEYESQSNSH